MSDLPLARPWFAPIRSAGGVTGWTEPHVHEIVRGNLWRVRGRDRDVVVDSGCGVASLRGELPGLFTHDPLVVCTHGHFDHTGGAHEFTDRAIHAAEAELLTTPEPAAMTADDQPPEFLAVAAAAGQALTPVLLDAVPSDGFDPAGHRVRPAPATRLLGGGDVIDLGDRRLSVLHLPGHSPGSIALHDEASGALFTGDVIYDGPLLDDLPESDASAYRTSLERLRSLPVTLVHPGHGPSFGRDRLLDLIDAYLRGA